MDNSRFPDIPYEMLDHFLFEEFIGKLHPSLRHILRDVEYMQNSSETEEITSIRDWWNVEIPYYTCTPWFIKDALPVSDKQMDVLGKVHLLYYADSILTDNLVDAQVPEVPGAFLASSQLRTKGLYYWLSLFEHDHAFWRIFQDTERKCYWGLAHELAIVEHHRIPYTVEEYAKVTDGKFAIYERLIRAMAYLSDAPHNLEPVLQAFRGLFIADCLFDDAADWQDDARTGRRTLPIVLAMQATNTPLERFGDLSISELEALINRSNMLPRHTQKALEYLENARDTLHEAELGDRYLAHLIERNYENAVESNKVYRIARGFDSFISALSK